jgi:predicted metal-dependent TIM-barrel fold hydrolase
MTSRTTDDYQRMAAAGIAGVIEPAFWMGQPRTQIGTFADYFAALVGWERFRARQFGIAHFCTIALNPKEANDDRLRDGVLALVERYLDKDGVVGVGEIGFDDITSAEEDAFATQLDMAKQRNLPALIHTPHRDKKRGTERTLQVIRDVGIPEHLVLVDHNTEETLPLVRETDCWAGHSIYPNTKMTADRMVALLERYGTERMVVNSAADWGVSDPLEVPNTARAMAAAGFSDDDIDRVVWRNPVEFFAQSNKLDQALFHGAFDQSELFAGNSVLRGQVPGKRSGDE